MKVSVEIFTGGFFYIELDNESTVGDLKRAIATQENLPADRMIFVLKHTDQQFSNNETSLLDCGVQQDSHIYLLFTYTPADSLPPHDFEFGVLDINPDPKKNDPIVSPDTPSPDPIVTPDSPSPDPIVTPDSPSPDPIVIPDCPPIDLNINPPITPDYVAIENLVNNMLRSQPPAIGFKRK